MPYGEENCVQRHEEQLLCVVFCSQSTVKQCLIRRGSLARNNFKHRIQNTLNADVFEVSYIVNGLRYSFNINGEEGAGIFLTYGANVKEISCSKLQFSDLPFAVAGQTQ